MGGAPRFPGPAVKPVPGMSAQHADQMDDRIEAALWTSRRLVAETRRLLRACATQRQSLREEDSSWHELLVRASTRLQQAKRRSLLAENSGAARAESARSPLEHASARPTGRTNGCGWASSC